MLNEIYDAASSLADGGISPKDWHKEYRSVRKPKLAFFVFLDQLGGIANIERVNDPAEITGLYTWESKGDCDCPGSQKNIAFPAVKNG
jgi:hypothetical protein